MSNETNTDMERKKGSINLAEDVNVERLQEFPSYHKACVTTLKKYLSSRGVTDPLFGEIPINPCMQT